MQGYLLKKKEKLGKWKQQYFVLKQDGTDSHLLFYDHPKRTKPKGLIDLNWAFLYQVILNIFEFHIKKNLND
jgi:Ras GTPase-activating protein 1